ncbi:hypothetical protein [Azospirillum sp. Sh1]|uniref:hypothetical protein n=1 Tax=Azospirillum sp. Sh1 TaxID=2607285 RepID=UPI00165E1E65|nr:hypothetical protein [Azospirillum sp. Sh1]
MAITASAAPSSGAPGFTPGTGGPPTSTIRFRRSITLATRAPQGTVAVRLRPPSAVTKSDSRREKLSRRLASGQRNGSGTLMRNTQPSTTATGSMPFGTVSTSRE